MDAMKILGQMQLLAMLLMEMQDQIWMFNLNKLDTQIYCYSGSKSPIYSRRLEEYVETYVMRLLKTMIFPAKDTKTSSVPINH